MTDSAKVADGQARRQYGKDLLRSKQEESTYSADDVRNTGTISSSEVGFLLSELVNVVGAILTSKTTRVWQVYGGFERVYESVLKIFSHGYRHTNIWGNLDLWPFVVGLRVVSPALGPCMSITSTPHPAHDWIRDTLQKLKLSKGIAALVSDRDHVEKHYYSWALLQSEYYVAAAITCLQALEENSSTTLANVNPKLLLGTYKTPPGTLSVLDGPECCVYSQAKPFVLSGAKSELQGEEAHFYQNLTASLPTSPLTEKEWTVVWDQPLQQTLTSRKCIFLDELVNYNLSNFCTMEAPDSHKCQSRIVETGTKNLGTTTSSHVIHKQTCREVSGAVIIDKDSQDVSQIRRESPDGSSDSSNYPTTSPSVSYVSGSTISELSPVPSGSSLASTKVMQTKKANIPHSHTGARPKEFASISKSDNHSSVTKEYLDVIESGSGIGESISPSLLQVNYGGDCNSEGDKNTNAKTQRSRGPQGTRTPQLRHRTSSGRLASRAADSDPDSEDMTGGLYTQTSRRRRRAQSTQQHGGVSVKSLIDSRGVLPTVGDPMNGKGKNCKKDTEEESDCCNDILQLPICASVESRCLENDIVHTPPDMTQQVLSPSTSITSDQSSNAQPHVMSAPISAAVISEVDGVAFSAPERNTGSINLSTISNTESTLTKKKTHSRSRSDGSQDLVSKSRLSQSSTAPQLHSSVTSSHGELTRENSRAVMLAHVRKRFMEDGGHSITPEADNGFFPRPQPGQSLIGFLSSKEFHKQHAALDRENAHFNISEAMIAALTQMQFDTWHQKFTSSPGTAEDSDEEIRSLQARIREKRRQKLSSSILAATTPTEEVLPMNPQATPWLSNSTSKLESTTDYSVYESPQSSSYESESDLPTDLEEEDRVQEISLSYEDTSLGYSGETSGGEQSSFKSDMTSAENVAINLLKHFNEQQLPKASELEWLVSEKDVPQKLLPLPTSVAVGPDDVGGKEVQSQPQLRGTSDWAPPRPQVILTLPTTTKRVVMMGTQGWRCAGCGMRVTQRLSRHFRLCSYLGRYFCTTCHSNHTTIIPAKILQKWDFKVHSVANFSFELIQRMKSDPLFNVSAVNPGLYKRCRYLHQIYIYRLQLFHTLPYINTCSRAHSERVLMNKKPQHWAHDPHTYSLDDLVAVKSGVLVAEMKHITTVSINHVAKCQVCTGRGFICEVCGRGEPIFPFQLDATAVCNKCNACYHAACYSPHRCPRCIRRETRRLSGDSSTDKND